MNMKKSESFSTSPQISVSLMKTTESTDRWTLEKKADLRRFRTEMYW